MGGVGTTEICNRFGVVLSVFFVVYATVLESSDCPTKRRGAFGQYAVHICVLFRVLYLLHGQFVSIYI